MCGGTDGNNYTENDFYTHDNAMIRRHGRAMKRNETVRASCSENHAAHNRNESAMYRNGR